MQIPFFSFEECWNDWICHKLAKALVPVFVQMDKAFPTTSDLVNHQLHLLVESPARQVRINDTAHHLQKAVLNSDGGVDIHGVQVLQVIDLAKERFPNTHSPVTVYEAIALGVNLNGGLSYQEFCAILKPILRLMHDSCMHASNVPRGLFPKLWKIRRSYIIFILWMIAQGEINPLQKSVNAIRSLGSEIVSMTASKEAIIAFNSQACTT